MAEQTIAHLAADDFSSLSVVKPDFSSLSVVKSGELESKLEAKDNTTGETAHQNGGSFGRGIISDYCSTVGTHWFAEMTNFNQKTIAVSFFLFFACIAPAITFGAMYAKFTHNWIGAVEMMVPPLGAELCTLSLVGNRL
jgi:hypothetical protein